MLLYIMFAEVCVSSYKDCVTHLLNLDACGVKEKSSHVICLPVMMPIVVMTHLHIQQLSAEAEAASLFSTSVSEIQACTTAIILPRQAGPDFQMDGHTYYILVLDLEGSIAANVEGR